MICATAGSCGQELLDQIAGYVSGHDVRFMNSGSIERGHDHSEIAWLLDDPAIMPQQSYRVAAQCPRVLQGQQLVPAVARCGYFHHCVAFRAEVFHPMRELLHQWIAPPRRTV